jgi:hypothetical protein
MWFVCLYQNFPHYLTYETIFGKNVIEHKMSVLIFYATNMEKFLILRKPQWDIIIMCIDVYVKYPLFLSGIDKIRILSTDFSKNKS